MHKFINNINKINFREFPFLQDVNIIEWTTMNLFFKYFRTTKFIVKYKDRIIEGIPYEVTDREVSGYLSIDFEDGEWINCDDPNLISIENQDGYLFFRRGDI